MPKIICMYVGTHAFAQINPHLSSLRVKRLLYYLFIYFLKNVALANAHGFVILKVLTLM